MILDQPVITTIISTSGAVIVGLGGMWINANQLGARITDLGNRIDKRIDDLAHRLDRLEDEFRTFKDVVNSKLAQIDSDIAKLMDRRG